MVNVARQGWDEPACPYLGLVADRRSHFTYPHPAHRCYARQHPATADPHRQTTYCLSNGHEACDRFPARPLQARGDVRP